MFSPSGELVASASPDTTVRLWDTATGRSYGVLEGHSDWVIAVVFSPNGKLVASASWDKTVRLWDTETGRSCGVLEGHSDFVTAVVFSPNGKLVASASWDKTVRLWDTETGRSCRVLEGHSDFVTAVVFSPNGKLVASASDDKTIRLWDVARKSMIEIIHTDGQNEQLQFSNDGEHIHTHSGLLPPKCCVSDRNPDKPTALNVSHHWVRGNMKNLLWLPIEYQPYLLSVFDNILAMSHANNGVTIISFDFSALNLENLPLASGKTTAVFRGKDFFLSLPLTFDT